MCSLAPLGTGKDLEVLKERIWKCKVRNRMTFFNPVTGILALSLLTCNASLTVSDNGVLPVYDIPHYAPLPSTVTASSSPSVSVLLLLLYSPPPTIPSSFCPSQCLFLSACFLSVVDTLFISVHIPHIYLCLLPRHSFRVPMSILSALILIHDLCCFFSWAYLLIFCAFVCLFWWLFTCWRLECEFTLFKVLG